MCTAQDIHSLHNEGPALQESRCTHQMQARGVAAASVRGHVVPQLRLLSENAKHLAPRARPGPLDHVQYKEPWPEAALPRCAGVMVVPSLRRPASRCRDSWRPPAYAQLVLHTNAKDSAQAVKLDVCRCAAFKNKHTPSSTVSTKRRMLPLGGRRGSARGRGEDECVLVASLATSLPTTSSQLAARLSPRIDCRESDFHPSQYT